MTGFETAVSGVHRDVPVDLAIHDGGGLNLLEQVFPGIVCRPYKLVAERSPAGIKPLTAPQAADATESGWNWGGWVGNAPEDDPRTPDTDR